MKTLNPSPLMSGRWSRRLNRWLDPEGPFHLERPDVSPSCGVPYRSMEGPHRQPRRDECCQRCLAIHDKREAGPDPLVAYDKDGARYCLDCARKARIDTSASKPGSEFGGPVHTSDLEGPDYCSDCREPIR